MKLENKSICCFALASIIIFQNLNKLQAKEILYQAESHVKQVKIKVRGGEAIFTEKYQDMNGVVTHVWNMNGNEHPKEDYLKFMLQAEKEEEALLKEEQELKLKEDEQKRKELLAQQEREKQEFLTKTRVQTLKRLVSLELEKVEESFVKLDKYDLQDYFVYQAGTFEGPQHFFDIKNNLINQAKQVSIKTLDELQEDQLKDILSKLEVVPDKVEQFFRQSVKYAVDRCNDTKRLKELLALI